MVTLIYFVLILGITIFVHELGHFIFAKKSGIYVYEFALGMGPKIFSRKRKNDETEYAIRLIPLGGFVQMAGEEITDDKKVPKSKKYQSKKWYQKFLTVIAGVSFNFIFAFILLWLMALIYGFIDPAPIIGTVVTDYPASTAGIKVGDKVIALDDKKVSSWDDVILHLQLNEEGNDVDFKLKREKEIFIVTVTPVLETIDEVDYYKIGIAVEDEIKRGFFPSLKFAFQKTGSLFKTMATVIKSLFTGDLGINQLSGPVGIYSIVGDSANEGFESILYLLAYLSINVGIINLLPIPAFDGGRILFLIIEGIFRKPVPPKVENVIHAIGFVLLLGILLVVTFNDIINIFN